jgi:hypothetical protein
MEIALVTTLAYYLAYKRKLEVEKDKEKNIRRKKILFNF